MTETTVRLDQTEEALFAQDVSDDALEMAAKAGFEGAVVTVAFCSGLDTCPAEPAA